VELEAAACGADDHRGVLDGDAVLSREHAHGLQSFLGSRDSVERDGEKRRCRLGH
jgi:hypothetical protein